MPTYIVADVSIHDPETYKQYMAMVPATIAKFDGRFAVRGATVTPLEGSWTPERFVLLEFPSVEQAKAWWSSAEYAPAKALRQSCSTADLLLVDGPSFDPRP